MCLGCRAYREGVPVLVEEKKHSLLQLPFTVTTYTGVHCTVHIHLSVLVYILYPVVCLYSVNSSFYGSQFNHRPFCFLLLCSMYMAHLKLSLTARIFFCFDEAAIS